MRLSTHSSSSKKIVIASPSNPLASTSASIALSHPLTQCGGSFLFVVLLSSRINEHDDSSTISILLPLSKNVNRGRWFEFHPIVLSKRPVYNSNNLPSVQTYIP